MPSPSSLILITLRTRSSGATRSRIRRWLLSRAKAAGAADPEQLTRRLMLLFAGVQSEALLERSSRPARDARDLARALIADAIAS